MIVHCRSPREIAEDELLYIMEAPRKWGHSRQELQRTGEAGLLREWREMLHENEELRKLAKDAAELADQEPDSEWYDSVDKLYWRYLSL